MARIPLNTIKSTLKGLLETANTTTGSPIDLSDSLVDRVRQVLEINIDRIPIQPSFFPCVTMFYDGKTVELQDIAKNMLNGRRRAEVDLKIVGVVWIDNINTTNYQYKDLADNECEQLMENIEQVLRNDPTVTNTINWGKTTDVSYHSFAYSEEANLRTGILNYKMTVFY